jgi:tetratricopeptide (TPR) repeat protein
MRKPLSALEALEADAAGAAARHVDLGPALLEWIAAAQLSCDLAANDGALVDLTPRLEAALAQDRLLRDLAAQRPTMIHDGEGAPTAALAIVAERLRVHAEAMEMHGCFELALTTVSAVCRVTTRTDPTAHALATLHLGRIARQMNDWEAAEDAYTSAIGRALHLREPPIAARGHIGLALLNDMRGNMPKATAHYRQALRMAVPNGGAYLQALQGLMSLAVARNDLAQALVHGWQIYDASADDPSMRFGALSELSVVALKAGFPEPARQGFRFVLTHCTIPRVRVVSLAGDIRAAAMLDATDDVRSIARQLAEQIARGNVAHEATQAQLHLAEALHRVGDIHEATRALAQAKASARANGFHEFDFRAEEMLTSWQASSATAETPTTASAGGGDAPIAARADRRINTRALTQSMRRFATLA